ncbi:piggyBac transposable element-derived protein 4 [Trichonephila clavipes]|nr:piggyBac transposable element-derived protein 4 [Trichonephila clavipes]
MNSDSENECLIEENSSDEEFSSSKSESDDDCLDSARDCCQIDVTSPLPSHPKFPFTGNPGIKVCIGDSGDPLEYFNLFLDDEMFSFIVEETNRYAESFFENAELTPASRALKWKKCEQGRDEKIYRSVAFTRRSAKTCGKVVLVKKTNSIHSIFLEKLWVRCAMDI